MLSGAGRRQLYRSSYWHDENFSSHLFDGMLFIVGTGFSVPDCLLAITIFSKVKATKKPPLEGDLYVSARRPLRNAPKRQAISRLEPGTPTAHMWTCLLLLPSGPDKVHRDILRWTQLSSLLNGRQTLKLLPGGRHQSCYSGLQVTGHR